jgi:hypothetical protein
VECAPQDEAVAAGHPTIRNAPEFALQVSASSKEGSEVQFDWRESEGSKVGALSFEDGSPLDRIRRAVLGVLDDRYGV